MPEELRFITDRISPRADQYLTNHLHHSQLQSRRIELPQCFRAVGRTGLQGRHDLYVIKVRTRIERKTPVAE